MYAFIAEDKGPDDEGVAAINLGGFWMPLVGADMKRVDAIRTMAKTVAQHTKKKITLVKFSARTDVEVILP